MANKEEEKILKITVRYNDALEGIKNYKKEIEGLNEAEKELNKADEDYAEELELIKAQRKEAEAQIRVLRKEIQNNIKIEREQEGSLKQLRAALSNATKEYDEMSKAERESAKGVELKNHINDITKELKGAEEETQRFYRNVGNYKNSIVEALGLNQGFAGSLMSMADGADDASGMITNMGSSLKAFGASCLAMLTNPVFLAIAGIAGAGIAFKWWYDYNKGIEEATRKTKTLFGDLSGDELAHFRNEIQSIADMYGQDFTEVLTSVNVLVKQFGIEGKKAADLVADGFHLGADINGEFLAQIKEYSPQFKAAGVEASEFVAILASTAKEGIFSDKGADAIKEAMLRIREMPQATKDALEGIGMDTELVMQKLNDGSIKIIDVIKAVSTRMSELEPTSQAVGTAIADVFGSAGEDAGVEFLSSLSKITTSMSTLKDEAGLFYENNERVLNSQIELNNAISDVFDNTGGAFETMTANAKVYINDTLAKMVTMIGNVIDYWKTLYRESDAFRGTIVVIGRIFNLVFTSIEGTIKNTISSVQLLGSMFKAVFTMDWDTLSKGFNEHIQKITSTAAELAKAWVNIFSEIPKIAEEEMLKSTNNNNNNGGGGGGGGGNKSPLDKEIEKEYQTRQDQIEKEAEIIRKRLELVQMEAEERYRLKMELLEKEKELERMRIEEEYINEQQRNEALWLLDLEYAQKAKELEKEKTEALKNEVYARAQAMIDIVTQQSEALMNEVYARSQAMMDIVTEQTEHERKKAEEQKKIQEAKANAITRITGALSDVLATASENNESLAKVAKGLAIAEIMISQGVAIAKAVEAATKSGGTWWTVAATIATAVATVTATISSALKSVNSAKVGGSAGGSGASSMTYTSSAMYNPMLAQLNSVGDNMMPYESRMRDEGMNEEMMTDAVTRGVQNQPAPVVSVVEITETQNRVKAIESMGDV